MTFEPSPGALVVLRVDGAGEEPWTVQSVHGDSVCLRRAVILGVDADGRTVSRTLETFALRTQLELWEDWKEIS